MLQSWLGSVVVSRLVAMNWQNIKHVSPTLPDFASGLWLQPPGNCPVLDIYGLSVTLPVLSYTVTVLS